MRFLVLFIISICIITLPKTAQAVDISVATDTITQLMIIDPNGKRCGYDPTTKTVVNDFLVNGIGLVHYYQYPLYEEVGPYSVHGPLRMPDMTPITFKVVLTGAELGQTALMVSLEENGKGAPPPPQNEVHDISYPILDVGQVATYEMSYTPLKSVTRTKIATSADLIADITTTGKLGLIGNAKFVNELIKDVQEIEMVRQAHHDRDTELQKPDEKNRSQGDKEKEHLNLTPAQKAIKEYKELLKEITEKYQRPEGNEFVKQEAYTVLKEDLDYIIGHIQ